MLANGTLCPAYGRDYKSAKEAKTAFLEGKDFIYNNIISPYNGKYCSVRDGKPGETVTIRFGKMAKVTTVKVPKGK